jgi:hypothetical protein
MTTTAHASLGRNRRIEGRAWHRVSVHASRTMASRKADGLVNGELRWDPVQCAFAMGEQEGGGAIMCGVWEPEGGRENHFSGGPREN